MITFYIGSGLSNGQIISLEKIFFVNVSQNHKLERFAYWETVRVYFLESEYIIVFGIEGELLKSLLVGNGINMQFDRADFPKHIIVDFHI